MTYLDHFGFVRHPFSLTPNRALFYPAHHQRVLDSVLGAIRRGEPIVKVVGEVGTGKTLLCRLLMQALVDEASVAFIAVPQADYRATVSAVCRDLGVDPDRAQDPYQSLADHLFEVHNAGHRGVLVVDEAQALDRDGLEAIRLLSNLETDDDKLLQIVLFGQPELDRTLREYSMRQVTQRITFNFSTAPFDLDTGVNYIRYRVERSSTGPPPNDVFDTAAMRMIVRAADGVPRVMNILADRALLAAYAEGARRVSRHHARRALADTHFADERPSPVGRLIRRVTAAGGY